VVVPIRWRKNVSSDCIPTAASTTNSKGISIYSTLAARAASIFLWHSQPMILQVFWNVNCVVFSVVHIFCVKLLITKPLVHDYNFKWVCNIFIRLPKMESPYQLTRRSAPCAARSAPTLLFFLFLVLYFATAAYSSPSLSIKGALSRWCLPLLNKLGASSMICSHEYTQHLRISEEQEEVSI